MSSSGAGPLSISVAKDLFRQDSTQSSYSGFVELGSGPNRARNPERPRSVKKGSAAASVGVRRADREEGDRSVHARKRAFAMENPPMKTELKNERLYNLRTKSSTDA